MPAFSFAALVAVLAALAAAESYPACTITLTPSLNCCAGSAGHTATSYVDCEGCCLFTPCPTMCDLVGCAHPIGVVADRTTTVTSCAASITPYMSTKVRPHPEDDQIITLDDPTHTCVKTATKTTPGCQDCGATAFSTTKTLSVDCDGCALETVDLEVPGECRI